MTTFKKVKYIHYTLPVIIVGDKRYAVAASREKAEVAARLVIENNLWTFRVETLLSHIHVGECRQEERADLILALEMAVGMLRERANPLCKALLRERLSELQDEQLVKLQNKGTGTDGLAALLCEGYDKEELSFDDVFDPCISDCDLYRIEDKRELLAITGAEYVEGLLFYCV